MHGDISVVVCAFNRQEYMDGVFKTIAGQTLQPAEIIVVDDGSTPPIEVPQNDKVRLIRLDVNQGPAMARNVGIREASGTYVAFLDSDDNWRPEKLDKQLALLSQSDDDVFGVFTAYQRRGRKMRAGIVHTPQVDDWHHYFLMGVRSGPGSTLMLKRKLFFELDGFNPKFRRFEDWDWLIRVARRYRFLSIDEPLADVVLSGKPNGEMCLAALDIIEKEHMPELQGASERRLFCAALAIERAAISRREGKYGETFTHLLKACSSPSLILREIKHTFNI